MIYADYNGSAPLNDEVKKYLLNRIQNGPFANPNTIHSQGVKVKNAMEKCREICASHLGAKKEQIIFNSGASEGISTIFHHELEKRSDKRNMILISAIEHSAVLNSAKYYQEKGYELIINPVDKDGVLNWNFYEETLKLKGEKIALVSIMAANNETGVIQPWEKACELAHQYGICFFSDTTQYIGKTFFNFFESKLDYAVLSGHKVGALIGSGLILIKNPSGFKPLIQGGGQEFGTRGGTQNFIAIESLAVALDEFSKNKNLLEEQKLKREEFEAKIKKDFPQVVIVGEKAKRLPGTTLIAFPGIHGQAVQIELESSNIFVSTSAACSDNEPVTSRVLKSMNTSDAVGRGVIRISFGLKAYEIGYESLYSHLKSAYNKLSKIQSF